MASSKMEDFVGMDLWSMLVVINTLDSLKMEKEVDKEQ
jgi:hypothetical protein